MFKALRNLVMSVVLLCTSGLAYATERGYMINHEQLRTLIKFTLHDLDQETGGRVPYSDDAVELLMMTAAHESQLGTYIKQINGPALGIFQMEPATFNDLMENYLEYRPELLRPVIHRKAEEVQWDLRLAIMMARLHYFRAPEPLPDCFESMAEYAKAHYNTELGKATPEKYLTDYKKYATL